jgi:hypothetical protein
MVHGLDAMVPGDGDLSLGLAWIQAQVAQYGLPMVASNLSCDGVAPFPATRTVSKDGVTVGFIGLIDPSLVVAPCVGADPHEAAIAAIQSFASPVDLVIALAHQPEAKDKDLATAVPGIDVIISGHGKRSNPVPTRLPNETIQLAAGSRGKRLGIAKITLRSQGTGFHVVASEDQIRDRLKDAKTRAEKNQARLEKASSDKLRLRVKSRQKRLDKRVVELTAELALAKQPAPADKHGIENRLRALGEDLADHPETAVLVEAAKVQIDALAGPGPNKGRSVVGKRFMGSTACADCHPTQHVQWGTTGHASAWSTLEDLKRSRDLDCWSCHATGAGLPGGPTHPSNVAGLENVGCEACHGAGAAHVAAGGGAPMTRRPGDATCVQCHDGVKDEGRFDALSYFPRVEH